MTAAKKKTQRAPEEGDPEQAKAIGTPGEPQSESEPPSDPEESTGEELEEEDEEQDEREPEPKKKTDPAPVVETKKSEAPSFFARFLRFWMTDLDGN